jgi:hypothetical protein
LRDKLTALSENVTDTQKQQFESLLRSFREILVADKLGEVNVIQFDMDVGGAEPIRQKDRRWTHKELVAMKEHIEKLTKSGLIEPSSSPWASKLVLVTKKDGSIRMYVDYRGVNKLCRRDAYPPPQVELTLNQLGKAKYFSSLDAESGYNQVPMTKRAKEISAFRCPFGFFEFGKMPFGLMNAGAVFQRMMGMVLHDLIWKICMVYVDDIIVYSETWEDHMEHLKKVFGAVKQSELTLNFKKCELARSELLYLGFRISSDGVKPNPDKVAAIKHFATPQSATQVRSFSEQQDSFASLSETMVAWRDH